jgi:hypothetical protein
MAERYNLCVPQEGKNGKTYWNQVGVMFKRDQGGFSIKMHLFPEVTIMAFPPKDDDGSPGRNSKRDEPDYSDGPPY